MSSDIVQVFDEGETDWLVHLAGARRILWLLAGRELHSTTLSFLSSLFYYHYVLGDFVRPVSSRVYVYPECQLEGRETTVRLSCIAYHAPSNLTALDTGIPWLLPPTPADNPSDQQDEIW